MEAETRSESAAAQDQQAPAAATLALGQQFLNYAAGVAELIILEGRLALASIRPAVVLVLVLLPLGFLLWVSLSATLAWSAYEFSGLPLAGFVVFTLVQLMAVIVCYLLLRRYKSRLTFRESRKHISVAIGSLHREIEQTRQTGQQES